MRILPDETWERRLAAEGARRIAGVDEAGRGPLAGPVFAAAVVLSLAALPPALRGALADSKTLSRRQREKAFALLREAPGVEIGLGAASVGEITRLNIHHASLLAMRRALARLPAPPDALLVDGRFAPPFPAPAVALVGGDRLSLSIAAASIVAKVMRDRLMERLDERFPAYGWRQNAGYPTAAHRAALRRLGPSPHHRPGFAGLGAAEGWAEGRAERGGAG
jgi:ribonuclease HII